MGFLYMAIAMPKSITTVIFAAARFLLFSALSALGLHKSAAADAEEGARYGREDNNYILMFDGSSPSIIPVPVKLVTRAIKRRVPIVRFGCAERERAVPCTICLELLVGGEETRDLRNCGHLFHLGCLDKWIDEGGVSCPLCRSTLLPPGIKANELRRED